MKTTRKVPKTKRPAAKAKPKAQAKTKRAPAKPKTGPKTQRGSASHTGSAEVIFHINEGRFEGVYASDPKLKITIIDQDDDGDDRYWVGTHRPKSINTGRAVLANVEAGRDPYE